MNLPPTKKQDDEKETHIEDDWKFHNPHTYKKGNDIIVTVFLLICLIFMASAVFKAGA